MGVNSYTEALADVAEYEWLVGFLKDAWKAVGMTVEYMATTMGIDVDEVIEMERLASNTTLHRLMEYARTVGYRLRINLEPGVVGEDA